MPRRKAMDGWETLEDGGSNRWIYARQVSPLAFVFLQIDDLVDSCGRDASHHFCGDVYVVDLDSISAETVESALRSCGYITEGTEIVNEYDGSVVFDTSAKNGLLYLASICSSYGAHSPMLEELAFPVTEANYYTNPGENNPYFVRLRASLRKYAELNLMSEDSRDTLLDGTVVNAIGQTAREFADGTSGLWEALRRIADDTSATPAQKLMLRLYAKAKHTLGSGPVPEDIQERGTEI